MTRDLFSDAHTLESPEALEMNCVKDNSLDMMSLSNSQSSPGKVLRTGLADSIAIIGIGCRLPGQVNSPHDFWRILCAGADAIEEVPPTRWDKFKFYDPEPGRQGKIITKWGGFLRNIDLFDPSFFGISPREAASMDPQQRLVLESAWEALEDAGQRVEDLNGERVGVFVGVSTFDYGLMQNSFSDVSGSGPYTNTGQALSICANRLSYAMNWKGPSMIIDTACSSSLLACHMAMTSIQRGESTMAVVSGVNFICAPSTYVGFTAMGMLSPDGRCRAFDAAANGFVRSEGGCSVILKPLSLALADGDNVYAILAGSACNQDGHTPGLTMPSQDSQESLVREACRSANIEPSQVRYVEAHGTGTPVGDPIEAKALGTVVGRNRPSDDVCWIGSVKANIGHLEAGSGIAGLIKAALVLRHRTIPPNVHFNTPNPNIDFQGLGLKVPTRLTPLPESEAPAYVGVNSFGFGGTNVHVILQEHSRLAAPSPTALTAGSSGNVVSSAPETAPPFHADAAAPERSWLIPVSARSPESLRAMALSYFEALDNDGLWASSSMADIAYTTSRRRSHHSFRTAVVARNTAELKSELRQLIDNDTDRGLPAETNQSKPPRTLAFVFSGQGPQWWAMGRSLLEESAVFRRTIERCDQAMRRLGTWSLIEELSRCENMSRIHETAYAQPAIFAIQVGLLDLWKSWGVHPDLVIGHSVGEISAAYAAGALSFEDAVKVIYHRGRTMGAVSEAGAMVAVTMSASLAEEYIRAWNGRVELAAVNGPTTVTLSGDARAIADIENDLASNNIFVRKLQVSHAFHSFQMNPVKEELLASLADINPSPSRTAMISTVTGRGIDGESLTAEYWWRNVREPVQFAEAMYRAIELDCSLFIEISPHPVLAGAIGESYVFRGKQPQVIPSLRRGEPEMPSLLRSLGRLYSLGVPIDWSALAPDGQFIRFPSYPWHKQSYWTESSDSKVSRLPCLGHPILGSRLPGSRLVFQGFIDVRAQPFAEDHKIQGHVLMPGTGFVEMGLALGKEIYGAGNFALCDVELLKAAFMPERETLMTQTIFDSRTGRYLIESQPLGQPHRPWTVHSAGVLRERPPTNPTIRPTLEDARKRCVNSLPANVFYDLFRSCGFAFGPSFRGLKQIRLGDAEMLGAVTVPFECEADLGNYTFHPAVLDACLQGNFGCFLTHSRLGNSLGDIENQVRKAEIFMPSGYDEVRLYRPPSKRMWTYVRMHERFKDQTSSDVYIFDDDGGLIAEIKGFKETLVGNVDGNAETGSGMLYEYEWVLQPLPGGSVRRFQMPKLETLTEPFANRDNNLVEPAVERELALKEQLTPICVQLVAKALKAVGLPELPIEGASGDDVLMQLAIPSHRRTLANRLIEILKENASLRPQVAAGTPEACLRQLFWQYPEAFQQIAFLAGCMQSLPKVLQGDMAPFEGAETGSLLEVEEIAVAGSPISSALFSKVAQVVGRFFENAIPGRPARIVELRGSSGQLARKILAKLPSGLVEYVFCDKDDSQFARLSESIALGSQLKFHPLDLFSDNLVDDIERSLPECELLISHDAMTGRGNRLEILRALYSRLSPGGVLLLVEPTGADRVYDLTFGLGSLCSEHCRASTERWIAWMNEAGFSAARQLATSDTGSLKAILVAQRPTLESAAAAKCDQPILGGTGDNQYLSDPSSTAPENWLVFADDTDCLTRLASFLEPFGKSLATVVPGELFAHESGRRFQINPTRLEDFERLLEAWHPQSPTHVLYMWSQRVADLGICPHGLSDARDFGAVAPVLFCQAWTKVHGAAPTNLWLISRKSQKIGEQRPLSPGQTPLWGLGRVLMLEFPHLNCKLVDLGSANDAELRHLCAEILSGSAEDELALRDEARYVHRFVNSSLGRYSELGEEPGQSYRLHLSEYGTLHGMRLRPSQRRDPLDLPTLVEVEVHAAALNFSDVIKALALYPGLPEGFVPVGIECAGVVTAVGAGVSAFKPGDEVVCITPMAIASHAYTDHRFVALKPKHLSMHEAATLPIAFLTAHYALNHIGHMEAGEKVLVNAATGGVGLAAIQLAQAAGAELFATAGTAEKRALLGFLGIEHIMDSRTLAFADEIMEKTAYRGVDLILNSLPGEAISKGMSILADYGRFLEIGKRDIYGNTPLGLRAFRKNVSLSAIDLDRGLREKPDLCSKMFRRLIEEAESGRIAALPYRVFPVTQVIEAFRYMAKAKHVGKVILEMKGHSVRPVRDINASRLQFSADASYLITGGLGGLGSALALWMADHGARCLVLASRRGVTNESGQQFVRSLEDRGVRVVIKKVDLSQRVEVQSLVSEIANDLPPLRGIMHGAAVLDDGLILQLDGERIERVCAPKMNAAWFLHESTQGIPLDFFVCHSSTSSVLGNAGQANYAAANAFLDGIAEYRRSIGLPALTINWGYLGDLGLAAGSKKLAEKFERQGVWPVPPSEGLPILGKLMLTQADRVSVMRLDWSRLRQLAPTMTQCPRFEQMMRADNSEEVSKGHTGSAIRNMVLATVPEKRLEVMLDIVRNKVARVLGTRPEKIELDRSLMDLGLDSLMGFELRNWIEGELRLNVPVVELMQGPTVEKLTMLVLTQLEKGQTTGPKEKVASQLSLDPSTLLDTDPEKTKSLSELMTMVGDVRGELQGSEDAIDLAAEASKHAAIFKEEFAREKRRNADPTREPKTIFMTGSTGFVGAYVLRHLLATDPRLQARCLVRAESTQDGLARIRKNLDHFGQWNPCFAERILPVLGDVARPQFGLSDGDYTQLSTDVDCVVHNAAGVNFLLTYTQLKPVNVEGTLNALRLAAAARVKPYFHVSTLFTFSILDHLQLATVTEKHNPSRYELLFGGYLQSKWVADNIVQEARAAGLPATIFRPGIVTGDSKTGASSNDIITRALASAIQLGCTPAEEMRFPFTPVDFVGNAIAKLVLCGKASHRNFHLVNNDTVDWRTVIGWLVDRHFRIDILPYADWLERLKQSSTESAGTMLSALLPLIPEVQLSEHAEGFDRPIFDCGDSNAMLNTLGVGCPAITPELIDTYVAYLFQSGAISADCRPGG